MESAGKRAVFKEKSQTVIDWKKNNERASLVRNLKAVHKFLFVGRRCGSAVARPGGRVPPNDCLCPHFGLLRIPFGASRNDITTSNNGKGIVSFKNNSCLKFSGFFAKFQATTCCTYSCGAIIRLINTPLRNSVGE